MVQNDEKPYLSNFINHLKAEKAPRRANTGPNFSELKSKVLCTKRFHLVGICMASL